MGSRFKHKVAVITGASSGIGEATPLAAQAHLGDFTAMDKLRDNWPRTLR